MSAEEPTAAAGQDLDEDLFNFDEIAGAQAPKHENEADLDEIFASFQTEEAKTPPEPPAPLPDARREAEPAPVAPSPPPSPTPTATAGLAPSPTPAPAPASVVGAPVPYVVASPGAMPRTMTWLFVALTSVNALLAIALLSVTGRMSSGVEQMAAQVTEEVGGFAHQAETELGALLDRNRPVTAPDPSNHEAFATAAAMIDERRYSDARRVLYALLAVVDRMEPELRTGIESRASYLIAETYQREAHERIGGRR